MATGLDQQLVQLREKLSRLQRDRAVKEAEEIRLATELEITYGIKTIDEAQDRREQLQQGKAAYTQQEADLRGKAGKILSGMGV